MPLSLQTLNATTLVGSSKRDTLPRAYRNWIVIASCSSLLFSRPPNGDRTYLHRYFPMQLLDRALILQNRTVYRLVTLVSGFGGVVSCGLGFYSESHLGKAVGFGLGLLGLLGSTYL